MKGKRGTGTISVRLVRAEIEGLEKRGNGNAHGYVKELIKKHLAGIDGVVLKPSPALMGWLEAQAKGEDIGGRIVSWLERRANADAIKGVVARMVPKEVGMLPGPKED